MVVLAETELHEGQVNWVNPQGYGRIKPNTCTSDHPDGIFVHVSHFPNRDINALQPGQKVKFNIAQTKKGSEKRLQAYNVIVTKMAFQGEVTEYNEKRGFGFIKSSEHRENIFVHVNDVREFQDPDILLYGQKVEFNIRSNTRNKRLEACDVVLVETAPLYQGTIVNVSATKDYGFIKSDGHETDIFVHVNDVADRTIQLLQKGWRVKCNILATKGDKAGLKLIARNVVIAEKVDDSKIKTEKLYYGILENDWLRHYLYNFIQSDEYSDNVRVWSKDIRDVDADHISSLRRGQQLRFNIDETKQEARNVVLIKNEE